jgi:SNF2 family DNA or RNA helicase
MTRSSNRPSAHDVRDYSRITAKAMHCLMAGSRWCLTGTPIQNSIDDVAGLYHFLKLEPYADPRVFREHVRLLCSCNSDSAMASIRKLICCIMLRRSISTVTLPDCEDLICRLEFNTEEAKIYDKAKKSTLHLLDDAIDGGQTRTTHLNVLPWINSLRMICNLGVRAKIPQLQPQGDDWNSRAAQDMFNSLEIAAAAICNLCSLDLSVVVSEAADQVFGTAFQPRVSSCSYLLCASCLEKCGKDNATCPHSPTHQMLPVSTFASELSMDNDDISHSSTVPTKISALLQDLDMNIDNEKWYVAYTTLPSSWLTKAASSSRSGQAHSTSSKSVSRNDP